MDYSYIAGFFDGEGSAMALTVRRIVSGRVNYRIRPVIKISQGTKEILEEIRDYLEYGSIVGAYGHCYNLQINGSKNVIKFVDTVGKYAVLKQQQLKLLKKLAKFQNENSRNKPYTYDDMEHMLDLRDAVFNANTWTRSGLKQKYPKDQVLKDHDFVDLEKWEKRREQFGIVALNQYAKSIKKSRELIPCKCGCGQMIEKHDAKGRERKYVRGHNLKKKVMKCQQK